jgi:predicted metal-dependent hydrolase
VHPLLRYTLDLFDALPQPAAKTAPKTPRKPVAPRIYKPFVPAAPVDTAQEATKTIATTPTTFAHPRANREVLLVNAVVAYAFERAKRRTIGFVIGPDGLVVRAPKWTPVYEVEAALQEKAQWIIRKLGETRERHQRREEARIEWRDGTTLPFFGGSITVMLDPGHTFAGVGAELHEVPGEGVRTLRVGLAKAATPDQIRDAVQAWLMRQAQAHFKMRLEHFAPILQVQWRKLSLSNAGTRWGSAKSDGSIRLNWRLIHFRPSVIDYVVVHELSHLRVMDHSPRFWDTVRAVVPDYAALRGQLKDDAVPRW